MFVIVRHGNTFEAGEPPRRIGARTDLPLAATGEAQGEALGRHFAAMDWRFARVLTSPLLRTRQTAAAIQRHLPGPAPQTADWLREIDHGPDEDRDEDSVRARIGQAALTAWNDRALPPPGWQVDAEERIEAWRAVLTTDSEPTLLVTSNGAARFALIAGGLTPPDGLALATGSYGVIERGTDGALSVIEWGRRP